jgi:hypothetical protein
MKEIIQEFAVLQIELEKKGGPESDGRLFEKCLGLRELILKKYGLPEKTEFLDKLYFKTIPTEKEITKIIKYLEEESKQYLLSTPTSDLLILKEAQTRRNNYFDVFAELKINTNVYTIFVYEKMFLEDYAPIKTVMDELKKFGKNPVLKNLVEISNLIDYDKNREKIEKHGLAFFKEFLDEIKNKKKKTIPEIDSWYDYDDVIVIEPSDFNLLIKKSYKLPNNDNVFKRLFNLANSLMNHSLLCINENEYRIIECEIYLKSKLHNDPYLNNRAIKSNPGLWYISKNSLAITFDEHKEEIYGEIVIRGLKKNDTDEYISGTTNILSEVFDNFNLAFIIDNKFGVSANQKITHERIYYTQRVGLNKNINDSTYINKPYRFITNLNSNHKFTNKEKVVLDLYKTNQINIWDIKEILGYSLSNL